MVSRQGIVEMRAIVEKMEAKQRIVKDFGLEAVQKAQVEMCARCIKKGCDLYPITTKGDRCPYYEEVN